MNEHRDATRFALLWRSLPKLSRASAVTGLLALIVSVVLGVVDPKPFFEAWLPTWLFLLAISLGAMANVMIHEITGGEWGNVLRPPLHAAMLALPLVAALAVPLAVGLPHLFPWARPDAIAHELEARRWYLNVPGFLLRNGAALIVFSVLSWMLVLRLQRRDEQARASVRRISVAGLLIYLLLVTLMAYDFIASLVPEWTSTAIGVRLGVAQFVAAFGFAVPFAVFHAKQNGTPASPADFRDLGNLLLTFAMMWAYIAFTQYLIIWGEDLSREITWYYPRVRTGWVFVGIAVVILEFALPVIAMLFRTVKMQGASLAIVCALALIGQWLDCVWLTLPSLRASGLAFRAVDIVVLIAQGGLWLAFVAAIADRVRIAFPEPSVRGASSADA
jgi:hypothetical protein